MGTVLRSLDVLTQVAAVALFVTVAGSVSWQFISRYVSQTASPWTGDLAALGFVWLSMLAIALGVRRSRHMVLDIWEYLPSRRIISVLVSTVASLVVCVVLVLLTWFGVVVLGPAFSRVMPGLGISHGWIALAIPVGCTISLIFAIEAWIRGIVRPDDEDAPHIPTLCEEFVDTSEQLKGGL